MDIEHDSSYHHKNKYVREVRTWADEIRYESTVHNAVEMVKSMKEFNIPADTIKTVIIKALPGINIKEIFELARVSETGNIPEDED